MTARLWGVLFEESGAEGIEVADDERDAHAWNDDGGDTWVTP